MIAEWRTGAGSFNQLQILRLLRSQAGISRADLVSQTGLGKATVSNIIARLIADGVLFEGGPEPRTKGIGRRPVQLYLNNDFRLAIGVELTGFECVAVLTDLSSQPLQTFRRPTHATAVEAAVDTVAQAVSELSQGHDASKILGVGVGVAGLIDVDRRTVIQAVNLGWSGVPLADLLEARLGKPVQVVRRQHAGALGEFWYGAGRGKSTLLYVSLGVGIGMGLVLRGELHEGANGNAGEIGHLTIEPNGQRCNCGNFGCLEALAGTPAVAARARARLKEGAGSDPLLLRWTNGLVEAITAQMVFAAAQQGDGLALEVVNELAETVGIGLAGVINLFNPDMIVIGGAVNELGDVFLGPLRETVRRRALSTPVNAVEIVNSSLGHTAGAIGAATLVLDRFFSLSAANAYLPMKEGIP